MSYTLLTGDFVIRCPDIEFHPDTPALVAALPRLSGRAPELDAGGISVRLEAIDAAGVTGVVLFADMPDEVRSADQDRVRGHVLSNAIDAYGRMVGFVFAGEAAEADGTAIDLGDARVNRSLNARLLAAGLVLPAFYATLPDALRAHLARVSRAARAAQDRSRPRSTADPGGAATAAFGR